MGIRVRVSARLPTSPHLHLHLESYHAELIQILNTTWPELEVLQFVSFLIRYLLLPHSVSQSLSIQTKANDLPMLPPSNLLNLALHNFYQITIYI